MKKKTLALVMAAAMTFGTMGMSTVAFAAEENIDEGFLIDFEESGSASVLEGPAEVKGLESGDLEVKAYQIIRYNPAGYYEEVVEGSIPKDDNGNLDPDKDAEKIAELFSTITSGTYPYVSLVANAEADGTWTYSSDELTAGTWIISVSGSEKYVYNPAIISVNRTTDGTDVSEPLNLSTATWGTDVYPKRSEPTITKEVFNPTQNEGVQVGDVLKFTLTADIPDYANDVTSITYKVSDTLSDGLKLVEDSLHGVTVSLVKKKIAMDPEVQQKFTDAVENNADSFVVDLSEETDFLIENGGDQLKIEYYVQVTSDAKLAVDEQTNTAKLECGARGNIITNEDYTKHYTFGIDTGFTGKDATSTDTGEFIKVDSNGAIKYTEVKGEIDYGTTKPLAGAEFELRYALDEEGNPRGDADVKLEDATEVFGGKGTVFTTEKDGRLEINGLDSDVQYVLVEKKAPKGYTLNTTPVYVKINAKYDEATGKLLNHDVVIDNKVTHYQFVEGELELISSEENPSNPFGFVNTKLTSLPSTGGIGTTIFTIGGCVIMIAAAGIFFVSRKKENEAK